jgi:hypothetical protein
MEPNFNQVVFKADTSHSQIVQMAIHPFFVSQIVMMPFPGNYGIDPDSASISDDQKKLADILWDHIPGLMCLFFMNGSIVIQHSGAFSSEEIAQAAENIVKPVLESTLRFSHLLSNSTHQVAVREYGNPDSGHEACDCEGCDDPQDCEIY